MEIRSFLEFFWIRVILEELARKMYFSRRWVRTSTPARHQLRERSHVAPLPAQLSVVTRQRPGTYVGREMCNATMS